MGLDAHKRKRLLRKSLSTPTCTPFKQLRLHKLREVERPQRREKEDGKSTIFSPRERDKTYRVRRYVVKQGDLIKIHNRVQATLQNTETELFRRYEERMKVMNANAFLNARANKIRSFNSYILEQEKYAKSSLLTREAVEDFIDEKRWRRHQRQAQNKDPADGPAQPQRRRRVKNLLPMPERPPTPVQDNRPIWQKAVDGTHRMPSLVNEYAASVNPAIQKYMKAKELKRSMSTFYMPKNSRNRGAHSPLLSISALRRPQRKGSINLQIAQKWLNILVVDNDDARRHRINNTLKLIGFVRVMTTDAKHVSDLLSEHYVKGSLALVLCDLDAIDVLHFVRISSAHHEAAVVMILKENTTPEQYKKCILQGATSSIQGEVLSDIMQKNEIIWTLMGAMSVDSRVLNDNSAGYDHEASYHQITSRRQRRGTLSVPVKGHKRRLSRLSSRDQVREIVSRYADKVHIDNADALSTSLPLGMGAGAVHVEREKHQLTMPGKVIMSLGLLFNQMGSSPNEQLELLCHYSWPERAASLSKAIELRMKIFKTFKERRALQQESKAWSDTETLATMKQELRTMLQRLRLEFFGDEFKYSGRYLSDILDDEEDRTSGEPLQTNKLSHSSAAQIDGKDSGINSRMSVMTEDDNEGKNRYDSIVNILHKAQRKRSTATSEKRRRRREALLNSLPAIDERQ